MPGLDAIPGDDVALARLRPHDGATLRFQPRIRKGAFFEAAWRHGCRSFSVYNRTYITSGFANPVAEYWQVVDKVALWPVMGQRQVEISGPDATAFLQLLTPRDMAGCAVGQCRYILITDEQGGILGDPVALRLAPDRYWLSTPDCDLELWAKGVAVHAGLEVGIRDAGVSVIQVQGPKSRDLMDALLGPEILELQYFRAMRATLMNTDLWVTRTGFSGEWGYEIYLADYGFGDRLFEALMQAGASLGVAPGAVSQARRIEAGLLSWGIDMTADDNPFEVGLGRLVDLDKADPFIGRSALTRLQAEPVRRRLVGLRIHGAEFQPNEEPWPVYSDGERIGRMTSLAYSPRLDCGIALAMVTAKHAEPGTHVRVASSDGTRIAVVEALPFVSRVRS